MFRKVVLTLICVGTVLTAGAQKIPDSSTSKIAEFLTRRTSAEVRGVSVRIDDAKITRKKVQLYASDALAYLPMRTDVLREIYDTVRLMLPLAYRHMPLEIYTDNCELQQLVPHFYRKNRGGDKRFTNPVPDDRPLVTRVERPYKIERGLQDRHIALWQSHGRYFDQHDNEWKWQRSKLWQTCEDLYTQSYVLPYLVPMLENAGAVVMLPRERDFQRIELIADNNSGVDDGSSYTEVAGEEAWSDAGVGFAHLRNEYMSGENPFHDGTVRSARTMHSGTASTASWSVTVPKAGDYAVYVSYKTLPESTRNARYTVHYDGGASRYDVNQTMGGGTWIYLGTFRLTSGEQRVVELTNLSDDSGKVVTADAVKIGGGMGNVARSLCDSLHTGGMDVTPVTSGYPRFCEGSRYWLQWAGFDKSVYNKYNDRDDYKDDYTSRSHWVNALAGGTKAAPKADGLHVPLDMAMAFHSDAGITDNDDIIGTLGIFYTHDDNGLFADGSSRYQSRELTDIVMSQIVSDVRREFEPEWRRRGMWNRTYYEARVPKVPTMLLELLSHQNLADMRYGHDPNFKFTVARAIYKGILRFLATQYGTKYVVQPLPVDEFAVQFAGRDSVRLTWHGVRDSLEVSARPKSYVVYTRLGEGGFDNGRAVRDTMLVLPVQRDVQYSFRVTAVNDGGESFPSETLSACRLSQERGEVMVVNAFDRLGAPLSSNAGAEVGFFNQADDGVAYGRNVAYIGEQRVFDPSKRREKDEQLSLGVSYSDYEGQLVGGNTFDYPALHGRSLMHAGYSYFSASAKAVENGSAATRGAATVDLVLGKQCTATVARGAYGTAYAFLPEGLRHFLTAFAERGGHIFASGSYLGSETAADNGLHDFATKVLHYGFYTTEASQGGEMQPVRSRRNGFSTDTYAFTCRPHEECYTLSRPEALSPVHGGEVLLRYGDSRLSAAVGYAPASGSRTVVMAVPFEAVGEAWQRDALMKNIMEYFNNKK